MLNPPGSQHSSSASRSLHADHPLTAPSFDDRGRVIQTLIGRHLAVRSECPPVHAPERIAPPRSLGDDVGGITHHHNVAGTDEIVLLEARDLGRFGNGAEERPHDVIASPAGRVVGYSVTRRRIVIPDDVIREPVEDRVDVTPTKGSINVFHRLDVLFGTHVQPPFASMTAESTPGVFRSGGVHLSYA